MLLSNHLCIQTGITVCFLLERRHTTTHDTTRRHRAHDITKETEREDTNVFECFIQFWNVPWSLGKSVSVSLLQQDLRYRWQASRDDCNNKKYPFGQQESQKDDPMERRFFYEKDWYGAASGCVVGSEEGADGTDFCCICLKTTYCDSRFQLFGFCCPCRNTSLQLRTYAFLRFR